MSAHNFSTIFKIGRDILATTVERITNSILVQFGDAPTNSVESNNAEWWQQIGFSSRPSLPVAGKNAAQTIAIADSENDICIASRDVRGQAIYGNLKDGETCIYASGTDGTAQGRVLLKADGSVNLVTTSTNTDAGKSVMFRVAPTEVLITSEFGAFSHNANGIQHRTPKGAIITLKDTPTGTVIEMVADSIIINGSSVSLGATATALNGVAYTAAGPANVISTSVFVSP